jgi:hypothetical protein
MIDEPVGGKKEMDLCTVFGSLQKIFVVYCVRTYSSYGRYFRAMHVWELNLDAFSTLSASLTHPNIPRHSSMDTGSVRV